MAAAKHTADHATTDIPTTKRLDLLTEKTTHLDSMLAMTYADAGESFREFSGKLQSEYMWACATLAGDIRAIAHQLAGEYGVSHG